MKLSVQFIYLFVEFSKRFSYNRKILKLLNYNKIFINSNLTKHYFSVFFFKIISGLINKFLILINYLDFFIKDYRVFYFIEFFIKFNKFNIKQWFFFYSLKKNKIFFFKDLKFRVDIINFFVLGRYIEFIRQFLYNNYINVHFGMEEEGLSAFKSFFKNISLTEEKLFSLFRFNIWDGNYVVYAKKRIKRTIFFNSILFLSNKFYNKYIKFIFLYNFYILVFFNLLFSKCLNIYGIMSSYNLLSFSNMFNNFVNIKLFSIKQLYLFLLKLKMDFPFYIFYDNIFNLTKQLRSEFFNFNIKFFVNCNFEHYKLTSWVDFMVIGYLSRLYYFYLRFLNLEVDLNSSFMFLWDIFEEWYHFDYLLLPEVLFNLNSWLLFFKYKVEFFVWQLYNCSFLNKKNLLMSKNSLLQRFSLFEDKMFVGSFIFFDLLSFYFIKYLSNNFELLQLSFIFAFINDFLLKVINEIYFISNFKIKKYYIKLKQFKYFFFYFLYMFSYYKFYNIYKQNYSDLYLEVWERKDFVQYFMDIDLERLIFVLMWVFSYSIYYKE